MAANEAAARATSESKMATQPQDITDLNRRQEEMPSSTPVEMSSLASKPGIAHAAATQAPSSSDPPPAPSIPPQSSAPLQTTDPISPPSKDSFPDTFAPKPASSSQMPPAPVSRKYSTAIGPSSDKPLPLPADLESSGPTLLMTLLLTSGARHPFKLDAKYLNKRNVEAQGNDPFNLSVYKLKELILREWREEWEAKPSSPSYIRLISFGKLLDDKSALKDSRFNHDGPNVVHMTIKPQDYIEEEDTKGGKGSLSGGRDGTERSPGCRCIVM